MAKHLLSKETYARLEAEVRRQLEDVRASLTELAASAVEEGLRWISPWGSLRYAANTALMAGFYADSVIDPDTGTPRPVQVEALRRSEDHDGWGHWLEQRLGKTAAAQLPPVFSARVRSMSTLLAPTRRPPSMAASWAPSMA